MTTHLTAKSKLALAAFSTLGAAFLLSPAWAQNYPVTAAQQATANSVAQKGVALSELADNAPDRYTVKSGDTLWRISTLYLKSPWRWPELWGMNRNDISNPHRIRPGQILVLERSASGASLRVQDGSSGGSGSASDGSDELRTVRLSPNTRYEKLPDDTLPTLESSYIEAFLVEPLIVDATEFAKSPRIVSTQEGRVVLSSGDRAYARGPQDAPLLDDQPKEKIYRVLGNATALKHPDSGAILGYETAYKGKALLVRSERRNDTTDADGKVSTTVTPATIDIISVKQEISVGDRLMPEPPLQLQTYTPHAPAAPTESRIVSVYGSAVANASQNQVVTITGGKLDGIDPGTVLAILKNGATMVDGEDDERSNLKMPNERVGLLMVFRTFEHLSYGLILGITDTVRVGDRLVSPR